MELTITSVDYAPEDLYDQVPFVVSLVRELPGPDRPDYWLGELARPIRWTKDGHELEVSHVILAARWAGTGIEPGVQHLPVGIAYVTDRSLLTDERLDFSKCAYVAIGIGEDTTGGREVVPLKRVLAGRIGRLFGKGAGS